MDIFQIDVVFQQQHGNERTFAEFFEGSYTNEVESSWILWRHGENHAGFLGYLPLKSPFDRAGI